MESSGRCRRTLRAERVALALVAALSVATHPASAFLQVASRCMRAASAAGLGLQSPLSAARD